MEIKNYIFVIGEIIVCLENRNPLLVHGNNSPGVEMSLHSNTLSWFQTGQSLFFLLNAACLAEKQQKPIS